MPATSERAPDPRPARTRAAIFAAARDLTATGGEVTVNALAKRAGVSRAAFYSHFSGLDDLMGAMFQQLFDTLSTQGLSFKEQGHSVPEMVRFGFGMMTVHVERHHPFLRGALDWKFSRRTSMILVDSLADLHAHALRSSGDAVPAAVEVESTARWITGGELALVDAWLRETEQEAHDGVPPDGTELLASILRAAPGWYTGIGPDEPVRAAELLAFCRTFGSED